jgi:hypothetical protein
VENECQTSFVWPQVMLSDALNVLLQLIDELFDNVGPVGELVLVDFGLSIFYM